MNNSGSEAGHYVVSARKYRPSTFSTVVGQEALTGTLKNAIESGRLAQAYLFCGPRGVGKTSCARIFAKTINCLHPTASGEACGKCDSCLAIERGNSFNVIELDAASNNSVDDIRVLTDQVNVPPQVGRYRVFIIDEVHMLSSQAFNAFLKTLEEPPKYVVFILATTEKHKVIPTILSRCQIYDFKRITIADMVSHLGLVAADQGIEAEVSALNVIARKADGAMRDALSIFDQVAAGSRGHITYASAVESLNVLDYDYYFSLIDAFAAHDVQRALMLYKEIRDKGFDSLFFINGLAGHIRDLMVAYTPQTVALLEVTGETAERYLQQARALPVEWYYAALELLNDCDLQYRTVTDKRLHVELCLIRLSRLGLSQQVVPVSASAPTAPPQPVKSTSAPVSAAPAPRSGAQAPGSGSASGPTTYTPGVRKAAPRGTSGTVRISRPQSAQNVSESTQEAPAPPSIPPPAPSAPKAPHNVGQLWEGYAAAHPAEHVLVSAMRSATIDDRDSKILVLVPHVGNQTVLNAHLNDITAYLRRETGNPGLKIDIQISTAQSRPRRNTPREALAKAVRSNQVLHHLLETLNVEIV